MPGGAPASELVAPVTVLLPSGGTPVPRAHVLLFPVVGIPNPPETPSLITVWMDG